MALTNGGCNSCYYGETRIARCRGRRLRQRAHCPASSPSARPNDVIVDGNITYADCQGSWTTGQSGQANSYCPYNNTGGVANNDTLGLIADKYVEVNRPLLASTSSGNNPTVLNTCTSQAQAPLCDPSSGNGITIDAAVLALNESFVVNNYGDGGTEGQLNVYGSIQQYARGPVGTFNGNQMVTGYQKQYTWDPLLDYLFPPSYLVPSTAAWSLSSVSANGGSGATANNVCPPLEPVYGTTSWITGTCSQTLGGLPNYPAETAPSPPTNVTATASLSGVVTVTWSDPEFSGGSGITNYAVQPTAACSGCGGLTVGTGSATSTTITGLTAGQSYTFTVTATNAEGTSSPSTVSNWIADPGAPRCADQRVCLRQRQWIRVGQLDRPVGQWVDHHRLHGAPESVLLRVLWDLGLRRLGDVGNHYRSDGGGVTIPSPSPPPTASAPGHRPVRRTRSSCPPCPVRRPVVTAAAGNLSATVSWTAPVAKVGPPLPATW